MHSFRNIPLYFQQPKSPYPASEMPSASAPLALSHKRSPVASAGSSAACLLSAGVISLAMALAGPVVAQEVDEPPTLDAQPDNTDGEPVPTPIVPQEREGLQSATAPNNTVRPEKIEHSAALVRGLEMPRGFSVSVFARDLVNPRILAVTPKGHIYVTEREAGRVTLLQDLNGDGWAEQKTPVATGLGEGLQGVHGLAVSPDNQLYMVTETELYRAAINDDGTLGEPTLMLDDLPGGGQHPNRTIAFGPDGQLYLSIGSSTNAVAEPNELHATLTRLNTAMDEPSVEGLEIYAEGLRNTIGFAWNPVNGQLYGWDHNSDSRGDDWPPEEINQIKQGAHYGWPFCGGDRVVDLLVSGDPEGMTKQEFCAQTEAPVLNHQGHVAGMQMLYYTGTQFPREYRNDAFVTLRGSWNRNPPVGYEILRIEHDNQGNPVRAMPFITGWLTGETDSPKQFGRLTGLAQMPNGSLLVTNDSHGIVYRIDYTRPRR